MHTADRIGKCSRYSSTLAPSLEDDSFVARKHAHGELYRDMTAEIAANSFRHVYDIFTCNESRIYQYNPETTRQSTAWLFQNEPTPTKNKLFRNAWKILKTSFFTFLEYLLSIPGQNQCRINAEWYTTNCLSKVFTAVSN